MSDTLDLGPDLRGETYGTDDAAVMRAALAHPDLIDGWALEFGTGSGQRARLIAERLPLLTFDSFEGLPEDWRPGFERGAFAQDKIPQIEGATVVVGLFEDTLPYFDWPDEPITLVHLDADLYSSTATALKHAAHLIQPGCIVVLDEAFGYDDDHGGEIPGEQRAWLEFAGRFGLAWDTIGHGREQLALRITARMLPASEVQR
jgi:hypothetical protein